MFGLRLKKTGFKNGSLLFLDRFKSLIELDLSQNRIDLNETRLKIENLVKLYELYLKCLEIESLDGFGFSKIDF